MWAYINFPSKECISSFFLRFQTEKYWFTHSFIYSFLLLFLFIFLLFSLFCSHLFPFIPPTVFPFIHSILLLCVCLMSYIFLFKYFSISLSSSSLIHRSIDYSFILSFEYLSSFLLVLLSLPQFYLLLYLFINLIHWTYFSFCISWYFNIFSFLFFFAFSSSFSSCIFYFILFSFFFYLILFMTALYTPSLSIKSLHMLIAFLNQITAQLTECFHSKSDNILQHMFWMKPKFQTTRVFLCDLTFSTPGLAFHVYLMNLFEPLIIYLKILVATVFFCHFSYIRQTLSLLFCLFYLLFSGFSLFLLLIIKCLFLILFSTIFFFCN